MVEKAFFLYLLLPKYLNHRSTTQYRIGANRVSVRGGMQVTREGGGGIPRRGGGMKYKGGGGDHTPLHTMHRSVRGNVLRL
jgi:hypothetical protein